MKIDFFKCLTLNKNKKKFLRFEEINKRKNIYWTEEYCQRNDWCIKRVNLYKTELYFSQT
jgi:hypothetical protein